MNEWDGQYGVEADLPRPLATFWIIFSLRLQIRNVNRSTVDYGTRKQHAAHQRMGGRLYWAMVGGNLQSVSGQLMYRYVIRLAQSRCAHRYLSEDIGWIGSAARDRTKDCRGRQLLLPGCSQLAAQLVERLTRCFVL